MRLRSASSRTNSVSGHSIARGIPGKPAPVPTSSTLPPCGICGARAAQSRKWRVTTSVGSVTAVRFITLFFSSSSAENFNKSSIIFSLTSG